jgi:hypothetical protein
MLDNGLGGIRQFAETMRGIGVPINSWVNEFVNECQPDK